jgi:hypothetical protein
MTSKKKAATKEITIAAVFGLVLYLISYAAIPVPHRTFHLFAAAGAMGGSALGAITNKKSKWWAIPLGVIACGVAAIFYFINVEVGAANPSDVAALAVAFTIMFLSFVFLMRMAGINSWAYPDASGKPSS